MPRVKSTPDFTYDELGLPAGAEGPGILQQAGSAAREFVCDLYQAYPYGLLGGLNEVGKALTGTRGMLDRMCRPLNKLPPPGAPLYSGGQCPNIRYQVRITTLTTIFQAGSFVLQEVTYVEPVFGPVGNITLGGIYILEGGGQFLKTFSELRVQAFEQLAPGVFGPRSYLLEKFEDPENRGFSSLGQIEMIRFDGQPDNCGDPKPTYPPTLPPVNKFTNTTNINITNNVPITVPITIIPTVVAPITNILRPEFNVRVGDIDVNLAPDGVRFSDPAPLPEGPNIIFDPRITFPTPKPIEGDEPIGNVTDLTPVLTRLDEIEDEIIECCDRNNPFEALPVGRVVTAPLGSGNSGNVQLPPKTFRIVTTITSAISKINTQSGDNSPSVYYAGWAWFEVDGGMSERLPIDAASKSFEPPARSTGKFAWKLQKDYTCSVTVYSSNE